MTEREFERTFEQHRNAIYQFAWRMTNSPAAAEDIAQEVFLTLLRREAMHDAARGSVRALLLGIARNLIWKRWRCERRWTSLDDDSFSPTTFHVSAVGTERLLSAAIADLPPLQREALILVTYEELSLHEIADTLLVEVGTVKSRLHRARENLKRMLAVGHQRTKGEKQYGTAK